MASVGLGFMIPAAATGIKTRGRRQASIPATFATKGTTSSAKEEKGFFEWLAGSLQRDQLLETDPVLKKVEDKSPPVAKKTVNSAPAKNSNSGGFGGLGSLFAKK